MSEPQTWTPAMEAELRLLVRREYRAQQRRDAACLGKDRFDTPDAARSAMPKQRCKFMVYCCQHCSKWHIGSHLGTKRLRESRTYEMEDAI